MLGDGCGQVLVKAGPTSDFEELRMDQVVRLDMSVQLLKIRDSYHGIQANPHMRVVQNSPDVILKSHSPSP